MAAATRQNDLRSKMEQNMRDIAWYAWPAEELRPWENKMVVSPMRSMSSYTAESNHPPSVRPDASRHTATESVSYQERETYDPGKVQRSL